MVAWIWKSTEDFFVLHLFCWGKFLVRKIVFLNGFKVQVNGPFFTKAWSVLQQAKDEAQWKCHGQTFVSSCVPGCCHVSAMRDCYPPFPLLLTESLPQSLAGIQNRVRRVSGGGSSSPKSGLCCCLPRRWGSGDPAAASLAWLSGALGKPRENVCRKNLFCDTDGVHRPINLPKNLATNLANLFPGASARTVLSMIMKGRLYFMDPREVKTNTSSATGLMCSELSLCLS